MPPSTSLVPMLLLWYFVLIHLVRLKSDFLISHDTSSSFGTSSNTHVSSVFSRVCRHVGQVLWFTFLKQVYLSTIGYEWKYEYTPNWMGVTIFRCKLSSSYECMGVKLRASFPCRWYIHPLSQWTSSVQPLYRRAVKSSCPNILKADQWTHSLTSCPNPPNPHHHCYYDQHSNEAARCDRPKIINTWCFTMLFCWVSALSFI